MGFRIEFAGIGTPQTVRPEPVAPFLMNDSLREGTVLFPYENFLREKCEESP
jgi:hypothetical protein